MAEVSNSPSSFKTEKTFKSYTNAQGSEYAQYRRAYHPSVYQILLDHHTATGGQFENVLDVGCGPGRTVVPIAAHFVHATGIDPSEGMINTARSLGGITSTSEPVRFEVSTAEDLGSKLPNPIPDGSVDLITASTAAHWFNMADFWPRAAKVLKPGGSVAIWAGSSLRFHPDTPNYATIQAATDMFEVLLKDYMEPGNLIARNLYIDLPLPWTLATPVPEFDEATFFRKEWNTSEGPLERFYVGEEQGVDLDRLEKVLATVSPVTRWREAHPDAVGTEEDVVRVFRRKIEGLLHEAGVDPGKMGLRGGVLGVMLIVKKKNVPF